MHYDGQNGNPRTLPTRRTAPLPIAAVLLARICRLWTASGSWPSGGTRSSCNLVFDPIGLAWRVIELPSFISNVVRYWRVQDGAPRSFSFRLRSYFSVPIGTERLEFDGHRVFDPATILGAFRPLRLRRFSYVDDAGDLVEDADPAAVRGWHSCGLFLLRKPPGPS